MRPRTFVRRGRMTPSQARARSAGEPLFGLTVEQGSVLNIEQIFGRTAPCFLEVGFGSGRSLLALAQSESQHDFIGVEVHRPGIGAVFQGIVAAELTNLRLIEADVQTVLAQLPDTCLAGIQFFFPDPWPKRRHHDRRLIQPHFMPHLLRILQAGGEIHLATDWEDYALHMMQVLSQERALRNVAGLHQFSARSPRRPCLTKFERRAIASGRSVRELQFVKG